MVHSSPRLCCPGAYRSVLDDLAEVDPELGPTPSQLSAAAKRIDALGRTGASRRSVARHNRCGGRSGRIWLDFYPPR